MDCKDCEPKTEWSGIKANLEHLCSWKNKMTDPAGTIERLWSAIEKKATKALMITILAIIISLVGSLFGLLYRSNMQILAEFSVMKTDIAVIKKQIE